jgi:trans-aconitate 2-methyltransferase
MMNTEWNPELYLRFKKERTQPSIDLVKRIEIDEPGTIIDIGCGPGNSTQVLRERWGGSEIIGIDNSEKMIEKATESFPGERWILSDVYDLDPSEKYDIVFSNAALQWIPDHERLIPHLLSLVKKGGILAFQVPQNQQSVINKSLDITISEEPFEKYVQAARERLNYTYYHILDNHEELLNWYKSTGMRPHLESLPENLVEDFLESMRKKCREGYSLQNDGKVIYPFNRLFAIAGPG